MHESKIKMVESSWFLFTWITSVVVFEKHVLVIVLSPLPFALVKYKNLLLRFQTFGNHKLRIYLCLYKYSFNAWRLKIYMYHRSDADNLLQWNQIHYYPTQQSVIIGKGEISYENGYVPWWHCKCSGSGGDGTTKQIEFLVDSLGFQSSLSFNSASAPFYKKLSRIVWRATNVWNWRSRSSLSMPTGHWLDFELSSI